jgi:hypothetical protein
MKMMYKQIMLFVMFELHKNTDYIISLLYNEIIIGKSKTNVAFCQ